jgi:hypothetical protein
MSLETKQEVSWELLIASCRQLSLEFLKHKRRQEENEHSMPLTAVESPLSIASKRANVVDYAKSLRKALIELDIACGLNPVQFQHEQDSSSNPSKGKS